VHHRAAAPDKAVQQGETDHVGSSGKKRTTMAKLNRESKLREKRAEKQARKAARKLTAADDAVGAASRGEAHSRALTGLDERVADSGEPNEAAAVADAAGRGR
jgi:hypothetical protein